MRFFLAVLVIAALGLLALSASADVNIGGQSRFLAMGGAGLASTDSPVGTSAINPAALGMMPNRFSIIFPNLGLRTDGASLSTLSDWAGKIWDLDGEEGIDIARELGKQPTMLDINANTGFYAGPFTIGAEAEARVRIIPNAEFQQYARTGELPADPSQMEALVWAEAAASLPSATFGFKVPGIATGKGDMWVGARLRYVKGMYAQHTIGWSGDPDNPLSTTEQPVQEESGLGGDFGIIYRMAGPFKTSFGLVATDLLKPSLGNIQQDTMWSAGFAMEPMPRMLVVADIVNITRAYDESVRLRCGAEFRPIDSIAVRAGYSGQSLTTGIGLFGVDFAFASKTPISISRTIRF